MDLQSIKHAIEAKTFKATPIIFVGASKFIPLQYINEIKTFAEVIYLEELPVTYAEEAHIFDDDISNIDTSIKVFNIDTVDFTNDIVYDDNIIVICNKISKDARKYYSDIIIDIPNLELWQIQDYVYSIVPGVPHIKLDWLISKCGGDINRITNECLKLSIFQPSSQEVIFDYMVADGAFSDLSTNTIFSLTTSLMKKDAKTLSEIMPEISNIDINDFGLLTILYNNFLNVANIQLGINATPQSLGMKPNQFNAIKYNCGHYSAVSLVNILKVLSALDKRIKNGEFPVTILKDYLILTVLSNA